MIQGDAVDNIPGLYKLLMLANREEEAKVLARGRYLATYQRLSEDFSVEQCYNLVIEMYKGLGFSMREVEEIGNLLWLRRYPGQIWSEDMRNGS